MLKILLIETLSTVTLAIIQYLLIYQQIVKWLLFYPVGIITSLYLVISLYYLFLKLASLIKHLTSILRCLSLSLSYFTKLISLLLIYLPTSLNFCFNFLSSIQISKLYGFITNMKKVQIVMLILILIFI